MAARTFDTQYHVDPAGSNDAPYETWAKAATSLQTIADLATAGDGCYCRGTETLGAPIDFDTNSGTQAGGFITFIGCALGGGAGAEDGTSVDGTRFVLDGDGKTSAQAILATTLDYIRLENFELTDCSGDGFDATGNADWWIWINCLSWDNGNSGWDLNGADLQYFFKCIAHTNGDHGFEAVYTISACVLCVAYNNGDSGFDSVAISSGATFFACVAHDNGGDAGDYGYGYAGATRIINCVADSEVVGIYGEGDFALLVGNRITNCTTGIDGSASPEQYVAAWNLIESSGSADLANPAAWSDNGEYAIYIVDETDSTNTNKTDPDAGDDGYNNQGADDFNLKASATYVGDGDDLVDLNYGNG